MLRILGRTSSINVRKVLWACSEMDIAYTREDWGAGFRLTSEPEFKALNPKSLVPVVIDGDFVMTESNAIIRYLARKHGRADLFPADVSAASLATALRIEEWMEWQAADLTVSWRYAVQALVRKNPAFNDPAQIAASLKDWDSKMMMLEAHLARVSGFICGEVFTLADIVTGLAINRWARISRERPELPAVSAYFERLLARQSAKGLIGEGTD